METIPARRALIAAMCLFGQVAVAKAGPQAGRPTVPAALAVPDDVKLVAHFHAVGAQVYLCAAPAGTTTYAWTLEKPDATLYDGKGTAVGTHGAGPTWTSRDGSSVSAQKMAQADAPSADAIPWLLLRATKTTGDGLFARITYVQRLGTKNGKPPAVKCEAGTAGTEKRVDYSADYYFYAGGAAR